MYDVRSAVLAITVFLLFAATSVAAQDGSDAEISGMQLFGPRNGVAYTTRTLFRTDDNGSTWRELNVGVSDGERLTVVQFVDKYRGMAVVVSRSGNTVTLARTLDGGITWTRNDIDLRPEDLEESGLDEIRIDRVGETLRLSLRLVSSSNFDRRASYVSDDDGASWRFEQSTSELKSSDGKSGREGNLDRFKAQAGIADTESVTAAARFALNVWLLTQEGTCYGVKSGCSQETRIRLSDGTDITPPAVLELAAADRENVRRTATPMFALSPGGNTRTSLNRGFDMCNAPTAAQMQTWWNFSPMYDMNIYMSGRNRACSAQPNLSAAWVDQVTAMGWGLIPTVVGYQSPCTASTTTAKLSYDVATAETQGRGEADIAVTAAGNLGLTAGSILYYDMERYDPPTPDTLGCRAATVAFLKGWTDRIKELGYKSGVYGSPKNAQEDWVGLPPASKMDAIWMARWDNVTSVWTYVSFPSFPTTEWANHQRIKQWQAPHDETWGGVTFNIDGDNSDGPVAGVAILKNRNADFDGDGRSDVSVFRPSDGVWYVLSSVDGTFKGIAFGVAADVIAPGDYDGDGRTDYCVFRPASGVWHMLTKAGHYSARQFGVTGDIPVPADYNGDGKTDIAVFRPSDGVWYIANSDSQGTYTFIQFGQAGDKPVPGDYDGDGRTDIAVYRPSNGTWYILRMSDLSYYAVNFGLAADLPAQGDYDGDGKTDEAVYRDGVWYLLQSTNGFAAMQFGLAGDIPSTGDFDGDGKADVAVFRPSTGVWYTQRSTGGFWAIAFGLNGDRPVESGYLPQ